VTTSSLFGVGAGPAEAGAEAKQAAANAAGVSTRRRILCILLSPAITALGIYLFVVGMIKIEIAHPWECLAWPILWFFVIPTCSFIGYHLPLFLPAKSR